jgi:hypothetical protein
MSNVFDVDIDVSTNTDRSKFGTRAMVYNEKNQRVLQHPSGVYLEPVPIDPLTLSAAIDYKYADSVGFLKVDILNNTVYDKFATKSEVIEAIETEPNWELLNDPSVISVLPHVGKHVDLMMDLKPRSIDDLADVLALIRPGKSHLIERYKKNKSSTRRMLYVKPVDKNLNYFKKAHAISYAYMIVCSMFVINKRRIQL